MDRTLRRRLEVLERERQEGEAPSPVVIYDPQHGEAFEDAQAARPEGTQVRVYIPDNGRGRHEP